MRLVVFILMSFLSLNFVYAQEFEDLNIKYMLRGQIYAGSSIDDESALGGFASSNNIPLKIPSEKRFSGDGFYLQIDTLRKVAINKEYNGYKLYIINKSREAVNLIASDSRLYVIAETFIAGSWQPIEYLPSSFCGNS